jgi:RES domain-containing protein
MSAVCWKCVDDQYLKEIIREKGEIQECSECDNRTAKAFTAYDLAEVCDPIFREHYSHGAQVPQWGEDDSTYYEQEGDPLSFHIQEVLGQSFSFDDEIVKALIENDGAWPPDGEEPFFSDEVNYVPTTKSAPELYERWCFVEEDLKHSRRFFSSAAKELFEYLFRDVETRTYWDASEKKPMTVVRELPAGSELFRARICHSNEDVKDALKDPYKKVGPPPPVRARAGRMNVDGVAVFYGALDSDTCLAELRPTIGGEAAVIRVRTIRPLRLLDFTRIKDSYRVLSYFQPDFNKQVEKNRFLRHLENLISQPVRPGRESDYLITQTMAEYLAHVHSEKNDGKLFQGELFDGLLFKSVQKTGGTNVVLFPKPKGETDNAFPLAYVDDSVTFFRTMTIEYKHDDMRLRLMEDGEIVQFSDGDEFDDENESAF